MKKWRVELTHFYLTTDNRRGWQSVRRWVTASTPGRALAWVLAELLTWPAPYHEGRITGISEETADWPSCYFDEAEACEKFSDKTLVC